MVCSAITMMIIERTRTSLTRLPMADCWFFWILLCGLRCFWQVAKTRITRITRSSRITRARRAPWAKAVEKAAPMSTESKHSSVTTVRAPSPKTMETLAASSIHQKKEKQ